MKGGAAGPTLRRGIRAARFGGTMWDEPYLETCCRSALHRLTLVGAIGRPGGLADEPCLHRLQAMDLAERRGDGRFAITAPGEARHASEILRRRRPAAAALA